MKDRALASRYAKALFELAAQSKSELKIEGELKAFLGAIENNKQFAQFFKNPIISFEEKKSLLAKTNHGKLSALTIEFISLLLEKGRFEILNQILECYHELLNASNHFEEVLITTARPLSENLKSQLEKILEKKIGEKIISKIKVDPSILGGINVQIRHRLFDGSVRAKLDSLKQQMIGSNS